MPNATFDVPCLTTFCRLDELGLEVAGQRLEPDRAVLSCRVVEPDNWCHACGCQGVPLDTVTRRLAHTPFGQQIHGHRGRKGDPVYAARRTLHTGAAFLTDRQQQRLDALFGDDRHAAVEVTWSIYQHMVAAYRDPDRAAGKQLMIELIDTVSAGVPAALREVITRGGRSSSAPPTCSPTSTGPAPATGPRKRSTAASSTFAAPPSASAT